MKTETEIYVEAEMYAKTEKEKRLFGQRVSRCISTEEFQTEAYIAGFLKSQKEYEEKLRWIPVEERLPENQELVLVKTNRNCVSTAYLHGKISGFITYGEEAFVDSGSITHWRSIFL